MIKVIILGCILSNFKASQQIHKDAYSEKVDLCKQSLIIKSKKM